MNTTITFLFVFSIFTACTVSVDKLPELDKLRSEIANGIEIPFQVGNTVIYESFAGICGNSSRDELNRYFDPQLNEQPYFDILGIIDKN